MRKRIARELLRRRTLIGLDPTFIDKSTFVAVLFAVIVFLMELTGYRGLRPWGNAFALSEIWWHPFAVACLFFAAIVLVRIIYTLLGGENEYPF
jgi:hypothetical protein